MNKITSLLVIGFFFVSASAQNDMANDPPIDVPQDYKFVPFLNEEPERDFSAAEKVIEEDKQYGAILVTNKGTMQIEFYKEAPKTVNNFIFLSLHHYFEGIVFHRVLEGFMAQTGDPTGTGTGGPGYQFEDELSPNLRHSEKGILSMANSGANTNGSQFFITFVPTNFLDGYDSDGKLKDCASFQVSCHSVFGKVTEGLEVLDKIQRIDPNENKVTLVAYAADNLSALQNQGVNLAGDSDTKIEDYLIEKLDSLPPIGEKFELEGFTGMMGNIRGSLAVGFFPKPDIIEAVYIIEKIVD